MTEQNLKRSFPLIRSGVLFALLFSLAAYAGSRMSPVISPDRISYTEAFIGFFNVSVTGAICYRLPLK